MPASFHRLALFALLALSCLPVGAQTPDHDAVKPVHRQDERWVVRYGQFMARRAQGDIDLLFVGDSITEGWEGAGKEVWAKHYGPRKAANQGIGGDRTQHILWRFDHGTLDGISPKLAVLMIGTNNSGANTGEQIADGVAAIIARFKAKLPKSKLLVLAVFPRGENKDDAKRKVNEDANARIAKMADGQMIHYLDIGPKFLNPDGTLSKEIMPDLLHLSPQGYQIWADGIEGKVKELMGEGG